MTQEDVWAAAAKGGRKVTFGSLCTGVGGFDLGFERAGMRCVFQCEQDAKCRSVLARDWPNVERTDDVNSDDTAESLRRLRPDLVCFGFPCQDVSVAGRRSGLAGERSGLFYRCADLVALCAPRWVVIENVPGLLSSNDGRDMGAVVGALADMGYWWAYRVLDAQWFGVAQRRRRVFIVGRLGAVRGRLLPDASRLCRLPLEVLFEPDCLPWNPPPSREAGQGVARCLATGTNGSRYDGDTENFIGVTYPILEASKRCGTRNSSRDGLGVGDAGDAMFTLQAAAQHAIAYRTSGNCGVMEQGDNTASLCGHSDRTEQLVAYQCQGSNVGPMGTLRAGDGGLTSSGIPFVAFAQNQRDEVRDLADCAGALQAQPGMKQQTFVASTMTVRRLTPRECERLMGWRDDHTRRDASGKELADAPRYRMTGNGVVAAVAEWIGNRLIEGESTR